jgi:hypothetical protein
MYNKFNNNYKADDADNKNNEEQLNDQISPSEAKKASEAAKKIRIQYEEDELIRKAKN